MQRKSHQKKLKEIADKHGISLATANEIVRSQWLFLQTKMGESNIEERYFPVVSILHLGKFVVTKRRLWVLDNVHKKYKLDKE